MLCLSSCSKNTAGHCPIRRGACPRALLYDGSSHSWSGQTSLVLCSPSGSGYVWSCSGLQSTLLQTATQTKPLSLLNRPSGITHPAPPLLSLSPFPGPGIRKQCLAAHYVQDTQAIILWWTFMEMLYGSQEEIMVASNTCRQPITERQATRKWNLLWLIMVIIYFECLPK